MIQFNYSQIKEQFPIAYGFFEMHLISKLGASSIEIKDKDKLYYKPKSKKKKILNLSADDFFHFFDDNGITINVISDEVGENWGHVVSDGIHPTILKNVTGAIKSRYVAYQIAILAGFGYLELTFQKENSLLN